MISWRKLAPWVIPALILLSWELICDLGLVHSRLIPSPLSVLSAGYRLALTGDLWQHLAASSRRAFLGFLIGGILGLVLGGLTGGSRTAEVLLDGTMQMIRTIPHLALIPLVILWLGVGEISKIFLVALGVFFPVYLNTFFGVRSVDPKLIEMGRCFGLGWWQLVRWILFPGALPSILVGVRYALGVMWLTLIVAETIAASNGIGYMAMNAREFLQTDVVLLSILLYALLGKCADSVARLLEHWLLPWQYATGKTSSFRKIPLQNPIQSTLQPNGELP